ncbi:hypothetical protein [Streptomyces levis]
MRPDSEAEFLAGTAVDEAVLHHPVRFPRPREVLATGQAPLSEA